MRTKIDSRGFTLVEMMIVVAIIGILASLSMIGIGRYERTICDQDAETEYKWLKEAFHHWRTPHTLSPGTLRMVTKTCNPVTTSHLVTALNTTEEELIPGMDITQVGKRHYRYQVYEQTCASPSIPCATYQVMLVDCSNGIVRYENHNSASGYNQYEVYNVSYDRGVSCRE